MESDVIVSCIVLNSVIKMIPKGEQRSKLDEMVRQRRRKHCLLESKDLTAKVKSASQENPLYVGGLDLSPTSDESSLVCGYTIYAFANGTKSARKVYTDTMKVKVNFPYMPGYLGFREAEAMVSIVKKQLGSHPRFKPDILLVDGNGILHPAGFGSACHVGVLLDIPTVGVAKKMHFYDAILRNGPLNRFIREQIQNMDKDEQVVEFCSDQQRDRKAAIYLPNSKFSGQPIFVSQGHNISLETALKVVQMTILYDRRRLPEPLFQADLQSRRWVAIHGMASKGQNERQTAQHRWCKFIRYHPEMNFYEKKHWQQIPL